MDLHITGQHIPVLLTQDQVVHLLREGVARALQQQVAGLVQVQAPVARQDIHLLQVLQDLPVVIHRQDRAVRVQAAVTRLHDQVQAVVVIHLQGHLHLQVVATHRQDRRAVPAAAIHLHDHHHHHHHHHRAPGRHQVRAQVEVRQVAAAVVVVEQQEDNII